MSKSTSPKNDLHRVREEFGLSWVQLSKVFYVSRGTIYLWSTGVPMSASGKKTLVCLIDILDGLTSTTPEKRKDEFLSVTDTMTNFVRDQRRLHASSDEDINRPVEPDQSK